MPFDLSPVQLILVLVVALVILGPKRLPEVGRSLGKGIREFKDSVTGNDQHDDEERDRDRRTIDPPHVSTSATSGERVTHRSE
jgi:sec-independent protein translocase protein TatA